MKGFLEHAAEFDGDGAYVHLESVDLLGRGASTDAVLIVDDNRVQAGMGQPRRGAKSAGAGSDHDSIHPLLSHRISSRGPPVAPGVPLACSSSAGMIL